MVGLNGIGLQGLANPAYGATIQAFIYPTENMEMWLDADDVSTLFQDSAFSIPVYADGDSIGGWKDKSKNGRNLAQSSGSRKPILKTFYQNGKPSIYFDGTDDMMDFSSLSLSNFTIYMASYLVSMAGDGTCFILAGNNQGIYEGGTSAAGRLGLHGVGGSNAVRAESGLNQWLTSGYNVLTWTNSKLFYNGEEPHAYDATGTSSGFSISRLGRDTSYDGNYPNIYIGEILVYSAQHDDTTRESIERSLATKWGVQLPGMSYSVPASGPGVVLTYDDCPRNTYYGFRHWKNYGRVATVYTVSDWVGSTSEFLDVTQLQEMDAGGWTIGNHTKSHRDLSTLTLEDQEFEMQSCDAFLSGIGLHRGNKHLCFPYGGDSSDTRLAMAATGMLTGRDTNNPVYIDPATWNPKDFGISLYGHSSDSLSDLQDSVNFAIENRVYCVILFHGVGNGTDEFAGALLHNQFLSWLVSQGIPTLTIDELYAISV